MKNSNVLLALVTASALTFVAGQNNESIKEKELTPQIKELSNKNSSEFSFTNYKVSSSPITMDDAQENQIDDDFSNYDAKSLLFDIDDPAPVDDNMIEAANKYIKNNISVPNKSYGLKSLSFTPRIPLSYIDNSYMNEKYLLELDDSAVRYYPAIGLNKPSIQKEETFDLVVPSVLINK